jgi:L-amino acid N-acyltransferase YncA
MSMQSCEANAMTTVNDIDVRLSLKDDLPGILHISNWAIEHTAANFTTEAEVLGDWAALWEETHEKYPWFVGVKGGKIAGFAMASPYKGR